MSKKWFVLLFLLVAIVVGAIIAFQQAQQDLTKSLNITDVQLLEVRSGQGSHQLLARLEQRGWTEVSLAKKLWLKLNSDKISLKVGVYEVTPGLNFIQLMHVLDSGKEKQFQISLIEGQTWRQWQSKLAGATYLQSDDLSLSALQALLNRPEISNFEGLFLPDTYSYTANSKASSVVKRAYQAMQKKLQQAWQSRDINLPLATPYEALILASIVEKETGLAAERPLIAGVFTNRLHKGMRLQTDPTVIYGIGESFDGDIKRRDLNTKTPYNTYKIDGLPPTPIAMPSAAAIEAVVRPQPTSAFYFVARGDGSHQFSDTLKAHNAAVRKYQLKGQ